MRKDKFVSAALPLALALAPAAGAAQAQRITVAGVEREYLVHVPPAAAGRPDALLLVLHGGGGTPAAIAAHTGFSRLADREGFIVAYPAARNRRWLDARPGSGRGDDVTFLAALADTLRRRHGIAPSRVFAAGISNGAMMSYRLACEAPGSVAGIGVIAGAMAAALEGKCPGTRPVAVLALHGTEDRLVRLDGTDGLLSVPASLSYWTARAGCRAQGAPVVTDRVRDGTLVEHVAYAGCTVPIELYTIRGGGHTWPGGPRVRARILGRTTRELKATEVLWRFFDRAADQAGR
ncbi:MAG TPA: PHB depolymerase family esterase [Gemmatimonadales bacterium]|nr:PHB depolymerase family esterase [Gemmatimonadales bacterium]